MQSAVRIIVSTFLLTSAIATAYHSSAKLRRDGVLNLYPFPRVGRASQQTWQVPVSDPYLDYAQHKRFFESKYVFPRYGRDVSFLKGPYSEHILGPVKRADIPGMWFGPRLGRSFKSDEDDITVQNDNAGRSEPELMEPVHEERKKRQIMEN